MRTSFMLMLLLAGSALGQSVVTWTDRNGVEHFSNDPASVPAGAHVQLVLPVAPPPPPPDHEAVPPKRAPPPPAAARREQEILAGLNRIGWSADDAQVHDAGAGPAFVHLADTSRDPVVVTAALRAISILYTPNPGAGATWNGKPYQRLRSTQQVYRVALKHLADDDFPVRIAAASVAGMGVWGASPDEEVVAALGARVSRETDSGVLDQLNLALWECHCARPEMVESALASIRSGDPLALCNALTEMSSVGTKHRLFDRAQRKRMATAAEPFLHHDSPLVRAAALDAWHANTDEAPDAVRTRLIALVHAADPFTRFTAVRLLGEDGRLEAVPTLLDALSDTTIPRVKPSGDLPGTTLAPVAEAALHALAQVSRRSLSRDRFQFHPRTRLEGAALAAEVARARAWAAAHARELKLRR